MFADEDLDEFETTPDGRPISPSRRRPWDPAPEARSAARLPGQTSEDTDLAVLHGHRPGSRWL
jgi:hypothetical protein